MKISFPLRALLCASSLLATAAATPDTASPDPQPWQDRLYTPTLLTRLDDTWFLVVCWQHRILFNRELDPDLATWQTLDDTLAGPHSITSDGHLFVVDDTGRHGLKVYTRQADSFTLVQTIPNLGKRTHRVHYDPATEAFYVLSSNSQDLFQFTREGDQLKLARHLPLDFLKGSYTRSFTLHDGHMFFTSGPGAIVKVRHQDGSFEPVAEYPVPDSLRGMNDVFPASDGWWYLTATPQAIVRTRDLANLAKGEFEDLQDSLGLKGTPYYLSEHEGRLWVPQITQYSGLLSFKLEDDKITDRQILFDFGPPTPEDKERFLKLPR